MQLTSAQSSLIVVAIYVGFGLLELIRTRLFAKSEQSRHDGIIEIVSTFTLLIATQPAILLIVGAQLLIQRTRLGKAMRATFQDSDTASLIGININSIYLATFALGSGLAAAAGALLGRTIDTRGDRTLGTLGGAAVGALAGREIERSGKRRCR